MTTSEAARLNARVRESNEGSFRPHIARTPGPGAAVRAGRSRRAAAAEAGGCSCSVQQHRGAAGSQRRELGRLKGGRPLGARSIRPVGTVPMNHAGGGGAGGSAAGAAPAAQAQPHTGGKPFRISNCHGTSRQYGAFMVGRALDRLRTGPQPDGRDWRHTVSSESLAAACRAIGEEGPKKENTGDTKGFRVWNLTDAEVTISWEGGTDRRPLPRYDPHDGKRLVRTMPATSRPDSSVQCQLS